VVGNVEELDGVWEMLDTCYNHSEKWTAKALDPIVKFQRYNIYKHAAIEEFYSLLRAAMIGAKGVWLLSKLINKQTLQGIMIRMPPGDWKHWAKDRTQWIYENTEEAFWRFVNHR
jgi:hypothetical protein